MAALNFKIAAELDAAGFKDASAYLGYLQSQLDQQSKKAHESEDALKGMKLAWEAIEALGVVEFLKKVFEASADLREQEFQLSQRVKDTGLSYENVKPKLDAFFDALTSQSGIMKDKLIPAFDFLVDRTKSVRESQELMVTTLGLARARQLDLSEAADLVARAYSGAALSQRQFGGITGLTTQQLKDHSLVLQVLHQRYDELAVNTDKTTMAWTRFKNSTQDFLETSGEKLSGFFKFVGSLGSGTVAIVEALVNVIVLAGEAAFKFTNLALQSLDAIKKGPKAMLATFKDGFSQLKTELGKEFDEMNKHLDTVFSPTAQKVRGDMLVDATKKSYGTMTDEMKKIIQDGNAAVEQMDNESLKAKLARIDAETQYKKDKLREQQDFEILTTKDQMALLDALDEQGRAKKFQEIEGFDKKWVDETLKTSALVGEAMGKALTGQKEAWGNLLSTVIGMVASAAEAYVATWTAAMVGKALLSEDYYGAAKAAAIGALYTAAIATAASAAQSAVQGQGGGGSTSASSGSSSASTVAYAGSSAPVSSSSTTAASQKTQITINVMGDVVDSDQFMNALASRLSSKVENADVRLIASGVK